MNRNRKRRGTALLLLSLVLMAIALYFSFRPVQPESAASSSVGTAQSPAQQSPAEEATSSAPLAPAPSVQEKSPAAEEEEASAPVSQPPESGPIPEEAPPCQDQLPAPTDSPSEPSASGAEPDPTDAPEETNSSLEPVSAEPSATCTISISCAVLLENPELCSSEKRELLPEDGWILAPVSVSFEQGESVFDLLLRTCRDQGILLEFENTPLYGSAYIEGIGNLYEFDAGSQSGWMYEVNGWYPNTGCSGYFLQDGDVVCWRYTCNRGYDIGGGPPAE